MPSARRGAAEHAAFPPAGEAPGKARQVRAMFSGIAPHYDLLNRLLSFGIDRSWRRAAAAAALAGGARHVLDVATGTGELALELKRQGGSGVDVVGIDFAEPMVVLARRKAAERGAAVAFEVGDGTALAVPDGSIDALTIAYGLRNFDDLGRGLREFARVLKPGGRLVVLEFPPPPRGAFGTLFRAYFQRVVPVIGAAVSGRHGAYRYLPASVLAFPAPETLAALMREAGFQHVEWRLQTFGVSALHVATRAA